MKAHHYARVLRGFREEEEPDLVVVRHLVLPGTTAVDLGANVGLYTKVLSELVGHTGVVLSVEPVPQTCAILTSNVRTLRLGNVSILNVAVSNTEGTLTMEVPEYSSGGGNFYRSRVIGDDRLALSPHGMRVAARTLDSIVEGVPGVSFVKCDVEGHERACLLGAASLLRTHRPAWLIEVAGPPQGNASAAADLLRLLGTEFYSAWLFDGRHLRRMNSSDTSVNYFFLNDQHLARLRLTARHLFDA